MWTIVTTMDDVSDPSVNVFGPFKSKREALAWAKRDRAAQAKGVAEEGDDPTESFDDDADTVWFGSFKWIAIKMIKPKKSKRA